MNGKTPYKKLSSFPFILLEDLLRAAGLFTKMLSEFLKSGTYFPTMRLKK